MTGEQWTTTDPFSIAEFPSSYGKRPVDISQHNTKRNFSHGSEKHCLEGWTYWSWVREHVADCSAFPMAVHCPRDNLLSRCSQLCQLNLKIHTKASRTCMRNVIKSAIIMLHLQQHISSSIYFDMYTSGHHLGRLKPKQDIWLTTSPERMAQSIQSKQSTTVERKHNQN